MGIKSDLNLTLKNYTQIKIMADENINKFQKSERYSEDYKNQLIAEEKAKFAYQKEEIRKSIVELIDKNKKKLEDSRKPIVKDLAFELRLNNVLKIIEIAGKDMGQNELRDLVEPFKDDYGTIKSIDRILRAQGINSTEVIPMDGVDYNISELDKTGSSLLHSIYTDNALGMAIAVSMLPDDSE